MSESQCMRRGGACGSVRAKDAVIQTGWRQPQSPYPPFEIMSADQIEAIHCAARPGRTGACR